MQRLWMRVVVVASIAGMTPQGVEAQHVYWTDRGLVRISRAELDGQNSECVLGQAPDPTCLNEVSSEFLASPQGIDFNPLTDQIYWADFDAHKILRANADGSNVVVLLSDMTLRLFGIAVDPLNGLIFWADVGNKKVERANLSNVAGTRHCLVGALGSGCDFEDSSISGPFGVSVDQIAGTVYWSDAGNGGFKLGQINSDGTNPQVIDLTPGAFGSTRPKYLEYDGTTGHLYWSDENADEVRRIHVSFFAGPVAPGDIETLVTPGNTPQGMALDKVNGNMYWTSFSPLAVRRSTLDGGSPQPLPVPTPVTPEDIVVARSQGAQPIPTTSDWGMLAMILMLLTAGTIVFRYRFKQQQCPAVAA